MSGGAGEPSAVPVLRPDWADLAAAVFEARGRSADDVRPVTTSEYLADKPQAAVRPLNSVLDLSKIAATGIRPGDWRDALARYLAADDR